jgi:hypothetical protein
MLEFPRCGQVASAGEARRPRGGWNPRAVGVLRCRGCGRRGSGRGVSRARPESGQPSRWSRLRCDPPPGRTSRTHHGPARVSPAGEPAAPGAVVRSLRLGKPASRPVRRPSRPATERAHPGACRCASAALRPFSRAGARSSHRLRGLRHPSKQRWWIEGRDRSTSRVSQRLHQRAIRVGRSAREASGGRRRPRPPERRGS